ncbi:hypothetical protein SAMN05192534_10931 [Alteribacillus persepolensis]|uniref:Uncharacterized protein n=1 Tax=Alteribacillus persepolensis TaxID=568899 RepID=A0A1G8ECM9_9BACI|nr:hypothetical protein [Alteribacillus persepolensis]SDH67500.1 hypothetical protein SAMN05192534_10931 [Alteribacillus persepolensis]
MDWTPYIGAIGAWGLIRRQQKKLKLLPFLLESLFIWIAIFVLSLMAGVITTYFNFYLPQTLYYWIGGIIMFFVACYLSFKSWKVSGNSK